MPFTPKRWGNPISDTGALEADELTDIEVRLSTYADSRGPSGNVDVTSYGAVSDDSTDSSTAVQNAINASSIGNVIWFPGKFRCKDITLLPYRTYSGISAPMGGNGSTVALPNAATGASYIFASQSYVTNAATPDSSITVRQIGLYGNRTNIASGTQHGLILRCWRSSMENLTLADFRGEGIRLTPFSANATPANGNVSEPFIDQCIFANNLGIAMHTIHNPGATTVDGIINRSNFSGVPSGALVNLLQVEGGGGWKVGPNNHFWSSPTNFMSIQAGFGTTIHDNVFEGPGESQTTSTHYCMDVGLATDHPVVIANNAHYCDINNAATRGFIYVGNSGAQSPNVVISGNNHYALEATDIFAHLQGDNGGTVNAVVTGNNVFGSTIYIDSGGTTRALQENNSWNWIDGGSPPAAGTFIRGTKVWRKDATASAAPGWVCTSGGTPGTWKAMANLAA